MRRIAVVSKELPGADAETRRTPIGLAIREQRSRAGLSLAALAERIGISLSTMSKIENGKISTSFERLESLAHALSIELVELLGPVGSRSVQRAPHSGTRRSVTAAQKAKEVDAGAYVEWYHATDMLHKSFQPMVAELSLDNIADYGEFTSHSGEEWNYVITGEMEFHSEVYAPIRLKAGESIYFDAEMKHAHIRVGRAPCRIVAVISPRTDGRSGNKAAPELRVNHAAPTKKSK